MTLPLMAGSNFKPVMGCSLLCEECKDWFFKSKLELFLCWFPDLQV
jgi:hypothetical protein